MPEAPKVSLQELRGYISDAGELAKGTQISDGGALSNLARYENKLFGEAKGSGAAPYRVSLVFGDQPGQLKARCSCMAARSRPFCKHSAALLVSWARSPESFAVSEAPPAATAAEPGARKSVKTGKAAATDLLQQGVGRVGTLIQELAVAGVAAVGLDRVAQVRQLGESLRENRLRRLSARTLELAGFLESAASRRGQLDVVAYADLLSDMLLTARKLEKHVAGEALDDRYVEELIGKTWRKTDRRPVENVDLVEYVYLTRVTADDYVIRESRFVDLGSGVHYSEKQILPAFLAKRTEPKRSYADGVLSGATGGMYPGFAPHRLDLESVPAPVPLQPAHVATILERAHAGVGAALAALQEHRRDVFAPDTVPATVRAELLIAESGRLRMVDAAGEALHLSPDPRLDEALGQVLRQGSLRALLGEMTIDGILATLVPMAVVIETANGLELRCLGGTPPGGARNGDRLSMEEAAGPRWLEEARRAGAPAAAIALGEVRLEMADALVTGLAGLVSRATDPLVSRLRDLGLEKPASVLAELPGRPDPADRLDGFVKVHQVTGLAVVRLASATSVSRAEIDRLPSSESIAIKRPTHPLTPAELMKARMDGKVTRYEAAWHRAKHFERLTVDELVTEWPRTWGDGEAAPFIARAVAPTGQRAVAAAVEVLQTGAAGRTARLTAIEVLRTVDDEPAVAALRQVESNARELPVVRDRARRALASLPRPSGWRAMLSAFKGSSGPASIQAALDQLTTATDKEARLSAVEELERTGSQAAVPALRQAWRSDAAQEVRARAAIALGRLGDSESVEALLTALRDRGGPAKEAKAALAALGELGDVRAVPEILHALAENWGGPLPGEALCAVGIPALEPIMDLVMARPDLAQRKSLQDAVLKLTSSLHAEHLLSKRLGAVLEASEGAEKAAALLKLAAESPLLREVLARQILARVAAPATKAEKALVRAAQLALKPPRVSVGPV